MSSQIFRRDAWQAIAAADPGVPAWATRWFPHTWMIARMLLEFSGGWAWLPAKLAIARGEAQDFAGLGGTRAAASVQPPADALRLWRKPPRPAQRRVPHPRAAGNDGVGLLVNGWAA